MNPTPPENPGPAGGPHADEPMPSVSEALALPGRRYSPANRRSITNPTQRAYSFLLIASTLVAAAFCLLYITKPVVITTPDGVIRAPAAEINEPVANPPEESGKPVATTEKPTPASATHDGHEETNLRVQHVLNASTPQGDLSRIVLDVPVLYASRNLRWTAAEVAEAREILARLADYHEQSRYLRERGAGILIDWNQLIERSIPTGELRADSPSLPANQEDASHLPRAATLDTTESIEIRPPGP